MDDSKRAPTASGASASDHLAGLVAECGRRRPIRAGSLIVTVFGDAIVPRGGSLWLGSLLEIMAGFGVEPGLVRTAMSRLVADGWFERNRVGKHSYHRLSDLRAAELATATQRIYRATVPAWNGDIAVAVLTSPDTAERCSLREDLLRHGYGQAAPNVALRPAGLGHSEPDVPGTADHCVRLVARVDGGGEQARVLARACWQLDKLEIDYARLIERFGALASSGRGPALSDAEAFRLRILLLHEYRRIVLRDPLLPPAMLSESWPGTAARRLVSGLYRRTLPPSERWLSRNARNESGPLPPAGPVLASRFTD